MLAALLCCSSLYADETITGPNWRLVVPDPGANYVAAVRRFVEGAEKSYQGFFDEQGLSVQNPRALKIHIFPTQETYRAYQKQNSSSDSPYAFYSLFNAEISTWPQTDSEELMSNLFHEAAHHFVRNDVAQEVMPRCLDEGIAEVFEVAELSGSTLKPGRLSAPWVGLMRKARDEKSVKPFLYFIDMPVRDFVHYSNAALPHLETGECWAITQFLLFSNSGKYRGVWRALLTGIGPQRNAETVMRGALPPGTSPADFDAAWQSFLQQL